MIPVPGGRSFLMPVAMMMSLYRRHTGTKNIAVVRAPDGLDVAASRTGTPGKVCWNRFSATSTYSGAISTARQRRSVQ